jgi:hypothetical protein
MLVLSLDPQNISNNKVCCLQKQQGVFDVLTSSSDPKTLQNVGSRCSVKENISKQWTVHLALSPYTQITNVPVIPDQTCSKTCCNPPYGPKTAIFSIPPQVREESRARRSDGVELAQNYKTHCSAKENVSKLQTVPRALSPYMQVTSLPVTREPMHLETCIRHVYSPKKSHILQHPAFPLSDALSSS